MSKSKSHTWGSDLTPAELAHLSACGISSDLAQAAQWRHVDCPDGRLIVGRNGSSDDFSGIAIPYYWPGAGHPREYRLRLANPPLEQHSDGTTKAKYRYLSPPGARNMLYFPPRTDPRWLADVLLPIIITEGEKKCMALAVLAWHGLGDAAERPRFLPIGISGVSSWRGIVGNADGPHGERQEVKGVIPDFQRIAWQGRQVTLLFDANIHSNEKVRIARLTLAKKLRDGGAHVRFADIPLELGLNGIDDVSGQISRERALEVINSAYDPKPPQPKKQRKPVVTELDTQLPAGPRKQTDLGNAERLVDNHGIDLHWSEEFGCFLIWDSTSWKRDLERQVNRWARQTVRGIHLEAAAISTEKAKLEAQLATVEAGDEDTKLRQQIEKLDKRSRPIHTWAKKSESASRIRSMIELARAEEGVPILAEKLDAHPMLWNVENGTIDLESGRLRPHSREDLLSKKVPIRFDSKAECPRWRKFLEEVFRQHPDVVRWIAKAVGYTMVGKILDHVFFELYGGGRNGKSTFMSVLLRLFAAYGVSVPFAVFTEASRYRDSEAPRPFLMQFKGRRLVAAQEPREGAVFNEDLIKTLTGGDRITARTLHEKPIEFDPAHKVWLSGNHKPVIKGVDVGIWSRPRLIPFDEDFTGREDLTLPSKLFRELPGILNWAVEGSKLWQQEGLGECPSVITATREYQGEQDLLEPWIDHCCRKLYGATLPARKGYEAFVAFQGGKAPFSEVVFAERMKIKGFEKDKNMYGRFYRGIELRAHDGSDGF